MLVILKCLYIKQKIDVCEWPCVLSAPGPPGAGAGDRLDRAPGGNLNRRLRGSGAVTSHLTSVCGPLVAAPATVRASPTL